MLADSEILAFGTGLSSEFQSLLFLFTQLRKKPSLDRLLSFLVVNFTKLLCNPSVQKQIITDLAQKPCVPISTAKICTLQPLVSIECF